MLQQNSYFFALEIIVLVVFLVGLVSDLQFWLKGTIGDDPSLNAFGKTLLAASGARRAFRRDSLGPVVADWLFQARLLRLSLLSWLMHVCFFWGVVILFFVGSLGLAAAERGWLPITKDTPWFALVNDFAGAMVLFAVAVALYRRFLRREWHLKTGWDDIVLIALLALIVLSGYLLEAARMVAQGTPAPLAQYAFIGYALSAVLKPLSLNWIDVESSLWWAHVIAGMSLVAYLPYSKLLHLLATPISVIASGASRAPLRDEVEV